MKPSFFELCVETLQATLAAERGGADRVELCIRLDLGGLTPGEQLTRATIAATSLPVFVLIRPRAGDFVYTESEFEQMREQIRWSRDAGAKGVVLGILLADGQIDVQRTRELVELAKPMQTTFHRAIDHSNSLSQALEAVIATGAEFLLTSGGASNVLEGADGLRQMVEQAGDRIAILAGGGLQLATLPTVLERSRVRCLHGSLTRKANEKTDLNEMELLEADVRAAVALLKDRLH